MSLGTVLSRSGEWVLVKKKKLKKVLKFGITSGTWNRKSETSPDSLYGGVVCLSLLKKPSQTTTKKPQKQKRCKLKACTPTLDHPCWKSIECYISGVPFSQSKGKWFFWEASHCGVLWLKTSSRLGGSGSDWLSQKDVNAARVRQRGRPLIWAGPPPRKEGKSLV